MNWLPGLLKILSAWFILCMLLSAFLMLLRRNEPTISEQAFLASRTKAALKLRLPMVFEAMTEDTRVVDIYEQVGKYKIEGNQAFQIAPDGTHIPVTIPYVLSLISQHSKHYKHEGERVTFSSYKQLAYITFSLTILAAVIWGLVAFQMSRFRANIEVITVTVLAALIILAYLIRDAF